MGRGAATDAEEDVGDEGLLEQPAASNSETRKPIGNVRLM
jgi:hypothetical protein